MSYIINSLKISKNILKNNAVLLTTVRNHWNKDYKPMPYPQTEEERLAAAKRYNLDPAEYKPYPDDGLGYGDYPKLPAVSGDARDPFYPYDCPELKRNFNEPLHADEDLIGEDRYNINAKFYFSPTVQWLQFLGVLGGCFLVYCLLDKIRMFPAVLPKQYPGKGKVHYTFEPKE